MEQTCEECGKKLVPVYTDFYMGPGPFRYEHKGEFYGYKRHYCPPRNWKWEDIDYFIEWFKDEAQKALDNGDIELSDKLYERWDVYDELANYKLIDVPRDRIPMSSLQSLYLNVVMDFQAFKKDKLSPQGS